MQDNNSPSEIAKRATILKDQGNAAYKAADVPLAVDSYTKALSEMRFVFPEEEKDQAQINNIRLVCYLNLAACQIRTQDFVGAKKSCSDALYLDPSNVKALYRRAQASAATLDFERAKRDITAAIKLSPSDNALRLEFANIKKGQEEYDKRAKEALSQMSKGMFSSK